MLAAVGEQASRATKRMPADGQLDLRRLLHILYPLAIDVSGADVELVAIQSEPDRDLASIHSLAPGVGRIVVCLPLSSVATACSVP